MADNTTLDAGAGGDTIASDDIGGVKYQRVKLIEGADGTNDGDISAANPLPVQISDGSETALVDGSGNLNTVETNSGAIKTAVEKIDNPVSGNEMLIAGGATQTNDVKITLDSEAVVLGAGSAAIGKLAANSGVDIGDVDVTSVGSVVDANNSTTTPLGIDAVFTGTGTDLLGYSSVCVTLYANVDSAVDGMTFEFSTDNSNWDDAYVFTMDVSSDDTRRFQFPVTARYFRVKYTNGGTGQAAFRVQTILHTANQLTSIHRLVGNVSPDRSAQIVKSSIIAQAAGSGDFVPVQATAGGNLKISIEETDDSLPVQGEVAEDAAAAGNPVLVGGRYDSSPRTLDTGDVGAIALGADGVVQVDVASALPAGTNAIGKLAANSGVDIGDVDVTSAPVRDRTTDNIGVALQTDAIMDDTIALTPVHLNINGNTSGNNTILAAQNGYHIRILALALSAHGNVNVTIEDGAAGADLIGPLAFDADTQPKGLVLPLNEYGWHQTSDNTLLNMALDAAVRVAGVIVYVLVPV